MNLINKTLTALDFIHIYIYYIYIYIYIYIYMKYGCILSWIMDWVLLLDQARWFSEFLDNNKISTRLASAEYCGSIWGLLLTNIGFQINKTLFNSSIVQCTLFKSALFNVHCLNGSFILSNWSTKRKILTMQANANYFISFILYVVIYFPMISTFARYIEWNPVCTRWVRMLASALVQLN